MATTNLEVFAYSDSPVGVTYSGSRHPDPARRASWCSTHLLSRDQKRETRRPLGSGNFLSSGKVQIRSIRVVLPSAYSQIS